MSKLEEDMAEIIREYPARISGQPTEHNIYWEEFLARQLIEKLGLVQLDETEMIYCTACGERLKFVGSEFSVGVGCGCAIGGLSFNPNGRWGLRKVKK